MKKTYLIAVLVTLAGCGGGPEESATPADAPPPPDATAQADAPPADVMEGVNINFFPRPDVSGDNVRPLLSIEAARVTRTGGDEDAITFEGATVVVPPQTPDAREIQFYAEHGIYVEGQWAELSGNVVAQVDDMKIELEDIRWEIVADESEAGGNGVATSNKKLRITSPTQQLNADSLRIDTAAETIELSNVTGEFTFVGETL